MLYFHNYRIRTYHFSYSTERTYISWIYRYIIFHNKRHPEDMGGQEIADFLTHLAVKRYVSASTQNQALNALVFLHKKVLKIPLDNFDLNEILVRGGKGDNDRRTVLPCRLIPQLKRQIEKARLRLEENLLVNGFAGTSMPEALERKYLNAPMELAWQHIFPSRKPAFDPRSEKLKQHFRHESYHDLHPCAEQK
ncbi:MAG: phage integrase N-terminal SAM-like domain-containing protein [Bacteroidota bacterium]